MTGCFVGKCTNQNATKRIPRGDPERRAKWIQIAKRILTDEEKNNSNIKFCKDHFKEDHQGINNIHNI